MTGMVVSLYSRNMVNSPKDYDEVFLCGPAQEVWEYLKGEMNWYSERKEFSTGNYSVISWCRSGAMMLYELETKREQNTRIRQEIAKELDGINRVINSEVSIYVPIEVLNKLILKIGEFGDLLLDTDIRYYEED